MPVRFEVVLLGLGVFFVVAPERFCLAGLTGSSLNANLEISSTALRSTITRLNESLDPSSLNISRTCLASVPASNAIFSISLSSSWSGISDDLVASGIHVFALDLRGFGESGGEGLAAGFPNLLQKSAGDADLAFEYLVSQSGVDASRIGVGGASCGGMITAELAARRANTVRVLMLLSSPPSSNAIQNVAENAKLAVFAAATSEDPITRGVAATLEAMVKGSLNPNSVVRVLDGTEHGLPMFSSHPNLRTELLNWLKEQLLRE